MLRRISQQRLPIVGARRESQYARDFYPFYCNLDLL
jgi:hypothetical protein